MSYFESGGPLMWPLLACSMLSLAVVIERILFWLRWSVRRDVDARFRLRQAARAGDVRSLRGIVMDSRDPVLGLVRRSLREPMNRQRCMQLDVDALGRTTRRYMRVLETVFTVAPLLGILGTVFGMIVAFGFGGEGGMIDPEHAIGGLSQAFITTAAGLGIAILSLLPYNAFSARIDAAIAEIEHTVTPVETLVERSGGDHAG